MCVRGAEPAGLDAASVRAAQLRDVAGMDGPGRGRRTRLPSSRAGQDDQHPARGSGTHPGPAGAFRANRFSTRYRQRHSARGIPAMFCCCTHTAKTAVDCPDGSDSMPTSRCFTACCRRGSCSRKCASWSSPATWTACRRTAPSRSDAWRQSMPASRTQGEVARAAGAGRASSVSRRRRIAPRCRASSRSPSTVERPVSSSAARRRRSSAPGIGGWSLR